MPNIRLAWISFVVLTATPLTSAAQIPPDAPFRAPISKPTLKRNPSTGVRMGALSVRFEESTLDDVVKAASVGAIAHRGDAGASIYWVCFTKVSDAHAERIWVLSDGEMGGRRHQVTGISAQRIPSGTPTAACPALPNKLTPLSLDHNLWLGASKAAVASTLGAFSYQQDGWRSYDYQGKAPGKCEGGYDVSASLLIHFSHGHADSLRVGQVTSC
jgi:hypothetical protein